MGTTDPKARERRTIFAGATIALALVIGLRGIPVWLAWHAEARDAAAVASSEASRTAAMYGAFQSILDSLEARLSRLQKVRPVPLVARNAQDAASVLTSLMNEAARVATVQITTFKVNVDSSKSGALPRASIVMDATGDVTGLSTLLREIEGNPVALAVRSVSVVPQNVQVPAQEAEALAIRIKVEALVLPRDLHATREDR
jgi:hypothetical protein